MKSLSVTIQMKAAEQYFLFCCTTWSQLLSLWMKSYGVTIEKKSLCPLWQYFRMVLFAFQQFTK